MEPVKKSLLTLHITVMILGGTALFSNLIPLPASDIIIGRSVFAFLALLVVVKLSPDNMRLHSKKDYYTAVLLGVLLGVHWLTYFAAMQYAGVSVGIIAMFTFPVITVLIEPFFERIKLVWQDLVSAILVLIGVYLLVPEINLQNDTTFGVLLGVISAVFYALRNLIHRQKFTHYSGVKAMFWQILVVVIITLPLISKEVGNASQSSWLLVILLGTAFTALPHALVAYCLTYLRAKTFSLISCMQPLYGVVLAMLLLDEKPTLQILIGGVLIVIASVYETLNTHKLHKVQD